MTHPFPTRRTEDDSYLPEAEKMLTSAVARDKENPFAWYQLGVVYGRMGDTARAALATAERYQMMGNDQLALASAKGALAGTKAGRRDEIGRARARTPVTHEHIVCRLL